MCQGQGQKITFRYEKSKTWMVNFVFSVYIVSPDDYKKVLVIKYISYSPTCFLMCHQNQSSFDRESNDSNSKLKDKNYLVDLLVKNKIVKIASK